MTKNSVQIGSYGLRDADGRVRTVNYVADALGFRASVSVLVFVCYTTAYNIVCFAQVSTNEPGVDPAQPAAATTLNGAAPVVPAALVAPVAPVALAAAPLLAAGPSYDAGLTYGKGAPLLGGIPSAYSVATQHVSAAPLGLAAGPLVGAPLLGKGLGLAGPQLGLGLNAGLGYGKGLY